MAIRNEVPLSAQAPVIQQIPEPKGTIGKVKQFMNSMEGISTMFSLLVGVAAAAMWGVQFGLLGALVVEGAALILCRCSANRRAAAIEKDLDPALQIQPKYESPAHLSDAARERRIANIPHLTQLMANIEMVILKQSPHFINDGSLLHFLRDEFTGVDASKLSLLFAHPVRLNPAEEGYQITIQSEDPQGWIRCYLPKEGGRPRSNVQNVQKIERVIPFLDKVDSELNYFKTLELPFADFEVLLAAFYRVDREMDLTQVHLVSKRPVHYEYRYMPVGDIPFEVIAFDGFELNFETPNGPLCYYVDRNGENVASPNELQGEPVLL